MDQTTIASVALPGSVNAHNLSVIALFLQADWVVKTVVILLFLASVWCACIVVGSPRLFEPDCQSPRQMRLANAFCRFLELAREVPEIE